MPQIYYVNHKNQEKEITLTASELGLIANEDGKDKYVNLTTTTTPDIYLLEWGSTRQLVQIESDKENECRIYINGNSYDFLIESRLLREMKKLSTAGEKAKVANLKSPMAGTILSIEVNEGDRVNAGEILIVIEAMKLQNEIKAAHDCVIKAIFLKAGESISPHQLVMEFDPIS